MGKLHNIDGMGKGMENRIRKSQNINGMEKLQNIDGIVKRMEMEKMEDRMGKLPNADQVQNQY